MGALRFRVYGFRLVEGSQFQGSRVWRLRVWMFCSGFGAVGVGRYMLRGRERSRFNKQGLGFGGLRSRVSSRQDSQGV